MPGSPSTATPGNSSPTGTQDVPHRVHEEGIDLAHRVAARQLEQVADQLPHPAGRRVGVGQLAARTSGSALRAAR